MVSHGLSRLCLRGRGPSWCVGLGSRRKEPRVGEHPFHDLRSCPDAPIHAASGLLLLF